LQLYPAAKAASMAEITFWNPASGLLDEIQLYLEFLFLKCKTANLVMNENFLGFKVSRLMFRASSPALTSSGSFVLKVIPFVVMAT